MFKEKSIRHITNFNTITVITDHKNLLYYLPEASGTNCYKCCGLKNRNVLSHSSGCKKS